MTTVEVLNIDADGGHAVERIEHGPHPLSLEVRERLVLAGAEAVSLGAEYLLPLVRAGLTGNEMVAREWAGILEQNLVAEREA